MTQQYYPRSPSSLPRSNKHNSVLDLRSIHSTARRTNDDDSKPSATPWVGAVVRKITIILYFPFRFFYFFHTHQPPELHSTNFVVGFSPARTATSNKFAHYQGSFPTNVTMQLICICTGILKSHGVVPMQMTSFLSSRKSWEPPSPPWGAGLLTEAIDLAFLSNFHVLLSHIPRLSVGNIVWGARPTSRSDIYKGPRFLDDPSISRHQLTDSGKERETMSGRI